MSRVVTLDQFVQRGRTDPAPRPDVVCASPAASALDRPRIPSRARIPTFDSSCTAHQHIEFTAVSLDYRRAGSRRGPGQPFWSLCAHLAIVVAQREILRFPLRVRGTGAELSVRPATKDAIGDALW